MISSTKLTAVQTAIAIEPLTSKSLAAAVGRPGDRASINPQPLPPKDVFGNAKAIFGALNTNAPAAGALTQFLTVNQASSLATPFVGSQRIGRSADGVVQQKVGSQTSDLISVALEQIRADQLKATAVSQLTKAEKLFENAYKTLSDPASNQVDRLRAQDDWATASYLRSSVEGLSPSQREALSEVRKTEWKAIDDANWAVIETKNGDHSEGQLRENARDFQTANDEFQLGVQENQSLTRWILDK